MADAHIACSSVGPQAPGTKGIFLESDAARTFASWALQAGIDTETVKTMLGHKTDSMVSRYAKPSYEMLQSAAKRMEESTNFSFKNREGQRYQRPWWSGRWGSNPRHQAWEACVLPLNYAREPPAKIDCAGGAVKRPRRAYAVRKCFESLRPCAW